MGTLRYALAAWFGIVLLPSLAGALPVISLTDETEQVIGGSVDIWLDETEQGRLKQSGRTASTRGFQAVG